MTQDYYEILQVHPRADAEAITAAYHRLRELYDPARLAGAADELVELARQKRDTIERAYATLHDPQRRAAHDRDLAELRAQERDEIDEESNAEPMLDYRPLPPARRQERTKGFNTQPTQTRIRERGRGAKQTWPAWFGPAVVATVLVMLFPISLLLTNNGGPAPAVPTATPSALDQYEPFIEQAKTAAEREPTNAKAWVDYGNMLYDSAQIVREQAQGSELYQQRLPRWLEASQAYKKALDLAPNSEDAAIIRADLGASSCYYGTGTGDQQIARQGLEETRKASEAAPNDPRVLLSLGNCYVSVQPPQPQDAVKAWQRITEIAPQDSQIAAQARELISRYQ